MQGLCARTQTCQSGFRIDAANLSSQRNYATGQRGRARQQRAQPQDHGVPRDPVVSGYRRQPPAQKVSQCRIDAITRTLSLAIINPG